MEYLYKLSFADKAEWEKVKASLNIGTKDEPNYPFYAFNEIGHVPIPATYDEKGEELTKALFHEDFAIDIYSKVLIPELDKYLIEEKTKYHNMPNGGNWNVIVKKK